jgi:hypothetical protein
VANCPDSWENREGVNETENMNGSNVEDVWFTTMWDDEAKDADVVFLTEYNKRGEKRISEEALRYAVLDSACSSTVCGEKWLQDYLVSLAPETRNRVTSSSSYKVFRFGGGERLRSVGRFLIPANIAGKERQIMTDVVRSDVPLLLSRRAMKRARMKLDLQNDTVEIFGEKVILKETKSGHYCIPINKVEKRQSQQWLEQKGQQNRFNPHKRYEKLNSVFDEKNRANNSVVRGKNLGYNGRVCGGNLRQVANTKERPYEKRVTRIVEGEGVSGKNQKYKYGVESRGQRFDSASMKRRRYEVRNGVGEDGQRRFDIVSQTRQSFEMCNSEVEDRIRRYRTIEGGKQLFNSANTRKPYDIQDTAWSKVKDGGSTQ